MQPKQNIANGTKGSFAAQIPNVNFHLRIEEGICSSKEWAEGRHWCSWLGSVNPSLADHGDALHWSLLWSSPEQGGESQAAFGGAFAGKLFESSMF